jgi:hypothetical protein
MPFLGILEIHKPFFRGASQHPKEALFQNGLSSFNMGTSYVNISLGHLADHLIYLSSSSSFWFSLNSSYDHDFHLSKRLGVTPEDYEYLLVAADLAHFHKRWGFSIKMTKLRLFLEGHRFTTINCDGTFEVDLKKVDLMLSSRESLQSIGNPLSSFGLVFCMPILPEKLRCRKIATDE